MGLWSWLFPSPEERIARARRELADRRFALARDEVAGLDHPDAEAVRREAENGLCELNLEEALRWAEAGNDDRVRQHLELAEELHKGGLEARMREARGKIREVRAARLEADRQEAVDRARRREDPGLLGRSNPVIDQLAEDDEELAMRFALAVESYPVDLRPRIAVLGRPFSQAVLDLDDGRPDLALQELLALSDDEPLVRWERARAAWALGDPGAAAKDLRAFAAQAGGHRPMRGMHSAEMLAQVEAEAGDVAAALRVLRDARSVDRSVGAVLFPQLLAATGAFDEAEAALQPVVARHATESALWTLLATIRVRAGKRQQAMVALEQGLAACCSTPGKCGSKPPDLEAMRLLSTLYLEDGVERPRALELAGQSLPESPSTWDEAYLRALVARARGENAEDLVDKLWNAVADDDPRRERLERYLPA